MCHNFIDFGMSHYLNCLFGIAVGNRAIPEVLFVSFCQKQAFLLKSCYMFDNYCIPEVLLRSY